MDLENPFVTRWRLFTQVKLKRLRFAVFTHKRLYFFTFIRALIIVIFYELRFLF